MTIKPTLLANPEPDWERARPGVAVDRAEVERRIGPFQGAIRNLTGGLANANVVVDDRVLRIYRRDTAAVRREAALLGRGWSSFRVPSPLAVGDDFLLLEYVAHGPLSGSADHGAATGRALAEIHALSFANAGFLDASLCVAEPFPDLVTGLVDYARSELSNDRSGLPAALAERASHVLQTQAPVLREVSGPPVLLHADFKVSNLHWTPDERLLVLDWEFAYAGAALSDIGQLLRWHPPEPFVEAFADHYLVHGGRLPPEWPRWAAAFDLVNLGGLLGNLGSSTGESALSTRIRDVSRRIEETLAFFE